MTTQSTDSLALEPLLSYLYGPTLGRVAADMAQSGPGERVVILLAEPPRPKGWGPTPIAEGGQTDGADELEDPLPIVEFLAWQGADEAEHVLTDGWDVVIGMPPLGAPRDQQPFVALLELLARTAGANARAVLFLVPGPLVSRNRQEVRAPLLQHGAIDRLLFSTQTGRDRPGLGWSGPPVVARWLPGAPSTRTKARVSGDTDDAPSYTVSLDATRSWSLTGMDPDRAQRIERWARSGSARPLRELVERPGPDVDSPAGRPVLRPQQITFAGIDLAIEVEGRPRDRADERLTELRAGDLVARTIGEPRWTLLTEDDVGSGLLAHHQVLILRPHDADPRYLLAFLRSDAAQDQLAEHYEAATIPRVPRRALDQLLVPDLGIDEAALQHADPIAGFRQLAEQMADDLDSRYRAAFDQAEAEKVTAALHDAARDARMAEALLRGASDPTYQARQFLPHPLARTLRVLENHRQAKNQPEVYKDLLRFGETSVILLGAVGLAYLSQSGQGLTESWQQSLHRGGVSLGTWHDAANAGAEAARRAGETLGGVARSLSTNSRLNKTLEEFVRRRNDEAHGAGPRSPYEYEQHALQLDELLRAAITELSPLARSDWFVVEGLTWSAAREQFRLSGRSLKGDHPDFEHWEDVRDEPLESNVVHARLGDLVLPLNGLCLLKPCNTCLHEELYYPDRLDGSTVRIRSLDRGHTDRVALEALGLPDQA